MTRGNWCCTDPNCDNCGGSGVSYITDSPKLTVYCDGHYRPLEEALSVITDDWVDAGNSCDQTVLDLVDACRKLRRALHRIAEFGDENEVSMEFDGDEIALHSVAIAKNAIRQTAIDAP